MQWTENGNFCSRTLESGGTNSSGAWVVTQSILRTSRVSYPLKINVEMYAEREPPESCFRVCTIVVVGVYYLPSKGEVGNDQRLNIANYEPVELTEPPTTATYFTLSFNLSASYDRFYMAVRKPNPDYITMKLRGLRVFYTFSKS